MKKSILFFSLLGLLLASCTEEELSHEFTVTVENVLQNKAYLQSGSLEAIPPGMTTSISFEAGKGHYLQFATMFAQSNDIFVAPSDSGIALYDESGNALTGDISAYLDLWDAGTEVNEMPGEGINQAPRQAGPDTGENENGLVSLLSDVNDGFNYALVNEMIAATLSHDGGTRFTLEIENLSGNTTLPSPFAPGAWVIHAADAKPLFESGISASIELERIAEDGNNGPIVELVDAETGFSSPFAPIAYTINESGRIFMAGETASDALENLAEDGDPSGFEYIVNMPEGMADGGPLFSGESYSFKMKGEEMENLSLALMLVQSNDWFIGIENFDLFEEGAPVTGDITSMFKLYDAGTEVDEYPGAGNNQPVRQTGPNTGIEEGGKISEETDLPDGFPAISEMIRVVIN